MTSAEHEAAQARLQPAPKEHDDLAKLRAELQQHPRWGKPDPEREALERAHLERAHAALNGKDE